MGKELTKEEIQKKMEDVKKEGLELGYICIQNNQVIITTKGKEEAVRKWKELPEIDRLLLGWLIRSQFLNIMINKPDSLKT